MTALSGSTIAGTALHRLAAHADGRPAGVAVRQKRNGIWHETNWRDYWRLVGECAAGLRAIGVAPGERVAILSTNRQEWVVSQLGIVLCGAVPVGLHASTTQANLLEQLRVAQPTHVVCEDREQLDKLHAAQGVLASLRSIVVLDPQHAATEAGVLAYDELLQAGALQVKDNPALPGTMRDALSADGVAMVTLSSGATGAAKAIEVSHGAVEALLQGLLATLSFDERDRVLSLLPLAHPTEQVFSLAMPLAVAASVNFPESRRSMHDDIREIAPTVFIAMPRVWEGLHREVLVRRGQTGRWRRRWLDSMLAAPKRHTPMRGWFMRRGLQDFLGLRKARFLGSVGAVTAPEALDFFRAIGLPLRSIYSLAEVGGLAAIGGIDEAGDMLGSVLPTLEPRIGADGRLEIRRKTAPSGVEPPHQGFCQSGDMVEMDGGRLRLLGRAADLIDGAHGPLHPSAIERMLKSSPFIRETLVSPGQDGRLMALVQIEFGAVGEWAKASRIAFTTFASLATHPQVVDLIAAAVRDSNRRGSPSQQVAGFALLQQELDPAQDELTPLLTVRRSTALRRHASRFATATLV